jgi:hypothetical protein
MTFKKKKILRIGKIFERGRGQLTPLDPPPSAPECNRLFFIFVFNGSLKNGNDK